MVPLDDLNARCRQIRTCSESTVEEIAIATIV